MSKTKHRSQRGASYVEVLVIAGIVVTLGAAAVQVIGSSASEKGEKQSACMQSFSCADGASAGSSGSPLAGVPVAGGDGSNGGTGQPSGQSAAPRPGTPVASVAPPPAPRGFWGSVGDFFSDVVRGGVMGDYAEGSSAGQVVGQIGVGLIPIVGQVADARDWSAAAGDVWNGRSGGWLNLAVATVAFVPLAGDAIKVAVRGGREVLQEGTQAAVRNADEIAAATRGVDRAESGTGLAGAVVRRTAQEALPALRQTTQNVFDAGPNRWMPTGNAADGTLVQRGLTGDYGGGTGGIREWQGMLEGNYGRGQTVSLVGDPSNVDMVTRRTTSIYNDPLAIQARVPPESMVAGRTDLEAIVPGSIPANQVTGVGAFIPSGAGMDDRLTWARRYLAAQDQLGIVPAAGSRGAQFNADVRGAIERSARWGENEYGRYMTNSDEVAAAVDEVLRRYETP